MKLHLLLASALAVAALVSGCGRTAGNPLATKKAGPVAVRSADTAELPALMPQPKVAPAENGVGLESIWSGSLGSRSAQISIGMGGWVRASVGRADFNGTAANGWVSGSLRTEQNTIESVSLNVWATGVGGRIGRRNAQATVNPGGWVLGTVGDRRMNVTVSGMSIYGTMDNQSISMGGSGVGSQEGGAMTAALLALLASAR